MYRMFQSIWHLCLDAYCFVGESSKCKVITCTFCFVYAISDQPSLSGLNELDYPSLPEAGISIDSLCEISNVKRVPLPPELVEQFERILLFVYMAI